MFTVYSSCLVLIWLVFNDFLLDSFEPVIIW